MKIFHEMLKLVKFWVISQTEALQWNKNITTSQLI